jgi:hypothetical protein
LLLGDEDGDLSGVVAVSRLQLALKAEPGSLQGSDLRSFLLSSSSLLL